MLHRIELFCLLVGFLSFFFFFLPEGNTQTWKERSKCCNEHLTSNLNQCLDQPRPSLLHGLTTREEQFWRSNTYVPPQPWPAAVISQETHPPGSLRCSRQRGVKTMSKLVGIPTAPAPHGAFCSLTAVKMTRSQQVRVSGRFYGMFHTFSIGLRLV